MTIEVLLNGGAVPISRAVFTTLLDNSVAGTYVDYAKALVNGQIEFGKLVWLCERGEIPYPLFFAPQDVVEAQVEDKLRKLLAGVSKDTFSIGSRASVMLRDIELIVKDQIRKQQMLRKHDESLTQNAIVGMLRKPDPEPERDAERLMAAIGLTHEELRMCSNRQKAIDLLVSRLEAKQILVSQSVQNHMPQRLTHVKFSGLSIKDSKVPAIFLAGGNHGDHQEPEGRTLFTLTLMTVLIARGIFAPMTWNGGNIESDFPSEYDVAGAMLMPRARVEGMKRSSLADIRAASDEFRVTASALTVRAMRLGYLSPETAGNYLEELRADFASRDQKTPRKKILPENAVRKYAGRELTRRMLRALDDGRISAGEFCRSVCLNVIKPTQIEDLRRAIK